MHERHCSRLDRYVNDISNTGRLESKHTLLYRTILNYLYDNIILAITLPPLKTPELSKPRNEEAPSELGNISFLYLRFISAFQQLL